jgi:hypothetical protein
VIGWRIAASDLDEQRELLAFVEKILDALAVAA